MHRVPKELKRVTEALRAADIDGWMAVYADDALVYSLMLCHQPTRINDALRPLHLTASQAEALDLLDRYGVMSLGELGALMVAEGGHPSRLIDRMVQAGLVSRQSAGDDRRRLELLPTDRGRTLSAQARAAKESFRSWVGRQIEGSDLGPVRDFFATFLAGTEMEETVRQRRERAQNESPRGTISSKINT